MTSIWNVIPPWIGEGEGVPVQHFKLVQTVDDHGAPTSKVFIIDNYGSADNRLLPKLNGQLVQQVNREGHPVGSPVKVEEQDISPADGKTLFQLVSEAYGQQGFGEDTGGENYSAHEPGEDIEHPDTDVINTPDDAEEGQKFINEGRPQLPDLDPPPPPPDEPEQPPEEIVEPPDPDPEGEEEC
jgi:hypothetical protein